MQTIFRFWVKGIGTIEIEQLSRIANIVGKDTTSVSLNFSEVSNAICELEKIVKVLKGGS